MPPDIRPAHGPIAWYLRLCGFDGWASLWGVAYILPQHLHDAGLIAHERCHLEQMRRDGKLAFMARYTWWLLRYGYRANPYEIEARKAQYET